jgi:hypothetical protein
MAIPQAYKNDVMPIRVVETSTNNTGIDKLFAAAVVNHEFCQLLLKQPETALQQGYLGDSFDLTPEEQALIISIRAKSLSELAQQITKVVGR